MRLVPLALVASLTLAPGCHYHAYAVPPALGAALGGVTAAVADRPGHRTSAWDRGAIGALIGLGVDVLAIMAAAVLSAFDLSE
jgi:hypothetical protein